MIDKAGSNFKDYAPVVSRLGLGVIMMVAGGRVLGKAHDGLAYDLITMGGLPDLVWGLLALVAGLLVFIGFATRMAGLFLSVIFLVMIVRWYGMDAFTDHTLHLRLACLALSLSVFCGGAGEYSVDYKLQQKKAR